MGAALLARGGKAPRKGPEGDEAGTHAASLASLVLRCVAGPYSLGRYFPHTLTLYHTRVKGIMTRGKGTASSSMHMLMEMFTRGNGSSGGALEERQPLCDS